MKEKINSFLYYIITATLYIFALTTSLMGSTDLQVPFPTLILLCAGSACLFYLLFFNKKTAIASLILFLMVGMGVYFYLRSKGFQVEWSVNLRIYAREFTAFMMDYNAPYDPRFDMTYAALLTLFFGLFTALCIHIYFSFLPLMVVAFIIFFIPVYMEWQTAPYAVYVFLLSFALLLVRKLNGNAIRLPSRETIPQKPLYQFLMIPLSFLLFLLALLLPSPQIDHVNLVEALKEGGASAPQGISFSDTSGRTISFFENSGKLGGPITLSTQEIMEVWNTEGIYLMGTTFDTYNGSTWRNSDRSIRPLEEEDGLFYTTEYTSEIEEKQQYYQEYYAMPSQYVTIRMTDSQTRNVFAPSSRTTLRFQEPNRLMSNRSGQLWADNMISQTPYTQRYINWNFQQPYFKAALQSLPSGTTLQENPDWERYLEVPTAIPQRVLDLTEEITEGHSSDLDKVLALEEYLKQFPYTLDPVEVPEGQDFIDFFLFEGQEGYCVYYASALTMMTRIIGLPSRYVEGFVTPSFPVSDEVNEDSQKCYIVTGEQAHAWTEVFFPEFGWIPFEPTSPIFQDVNAEESVSPEEIPPTEEEKEELPEEPVSPEIIHQEEVEEKMPARKTMSKGVKIILIVVLIVAVLYGILQLLRYRFRQKWEKIKEYSPQKASLFYYQQLLHVLSMLGIPKSRNETVLEYAKRLQREEEPLPLDVATMAEISMKATYSKEEITLEEQKQMEQLYDNGIQLLKESPKSKVKYWIYRYLRQPEKQQHKK